MADNVVGSGIKGTGIPRSVINGTPRKADVSKGEVQIYDAETGTVHVVSRSNARDLVEHSGGAWSYQSPKKVSTDGEKTEKCCA